MQILYIFINCAKYIAFQFPSNSYINNKYNKNFALLSKFPFARHKGLACYDHFYGSAINFKNK